MKFKNLKNSKDKYLKNFIFKQIELIKLILNIPKNSRIFFLGYHRNLHCFLYKNKVIFSDWSCEKDEKLKYRMETFDIKDLFVITLLKEYPKTKDDIIFEVIKRGANTYTESDFLNWIDMPSRINIDIDLPYYKIIKFLQNYNFKTFQSGNYLFYSKKDNDYCYTLNIYAKDLKNNAELKLYIPRKYIQLENDESVYIPPEILKDFVAVDLSGNLSNYQIRQCKKEFLKFANEYFDELKTKSFYALELIKQAIQPIQYDSGWAVCRIFAGDNDFANIWVSDFMLKDEKPYFILTDNKISWYTTKVATIYFETAKYHNDGIYKQGIVKFKNWKLDKNYIEKLIKFLNSPIDENFKKYTYEKYVKTNWQQMIFEYNHNTADWGWDENGFEVPPDEKLGQLPFDLPIPDYLKLLNNSEAN